MIAFDVKKVVAPMVNQSDAPFRTLCFKYGATCAFTEMLYSERIINDDFYLESMIPGQDHCLFNVYSSNDTSSNTKSLTRPLVAQICGNDPDILGYQCILYIYC